MFDIGWPELFVVAVLALIVVGPKDLPKTIKLVMGWVRKARSMARDFQDGVDQMMREAELDDVKKELLDGGNDLKKQVESAVDAESISKDLDISEDAAEKLTSNAVDGKDATEVLEPSDEVEGEGEPIAPADDDDDVMPIPSTSKTEQKS